MSEGSGNPTVCHAVPGECFSGSTDHTSLRPSAYDCGSAPPPPPPPAPPAPPPCSRSPNSLSACCVREPRAPSASSVALALTSTPRENPPRRWETPSLATPTSPVTTPATALVASLRFSSSSSAEAAKPGNTSTPASSALLPRYRTSSPRDRTRPLHFLLFICGGVGSLHADFSDK